MTYKADDEITLTFSGLKKAQNEAFKDGIIYAANRIERFFETNPELRKILELLSVLENVKPYDDCSCEENCDAEGCEA